MSGYSASQVAKMLGLSVRQVRSYVHDGFLPGQRGPKGELRFSFQDLVFLRTARGLLSARVPSRRVRQALRKVREQLPEGQALSAVHIAAQGDRVVVRDGKAMWSPESGQALFDFEASGLTETVAPFVQQAQSALDERSLSAEEWFQWALDLEDGAADQARVAYERALALDAGHGDACINLGRLFHQAGRLMDAEAMYRRALGAQPENGTAAYNLGVVLEDQGRPQQAIEAYQRSLECQPELADAHFNLARLLQRSGREQAALQHLAAYRKLTRN